MADPTHRQFAADARATYTALVDEGFTPDQAVALLCQIVHPAAVVSGADRATAGRRAAVEQLLAGKKTPATRSPVDDRSADLWNPTAPDLGAPAHD
ncbi:hypothetical protein [Micromonospora rubida]